ncbi:uncharacterized protein [Linepithema humile]|uniref:uncharacterized protein n=1 Tax=Linepithema humile TaxID=83485 RepID=UPI00351DFFFC
MVRRKAAPSSHTQRSQSDKLPGKERVSRTVYNVSRQNRVMQEIKHLRNTTNFLIPKACFMRVVRQIFLELFPRKDVIRIQALALQALQEAAEMYVTQFFEDAVLLAYHAKRVTLMRNDMILMRRLRGRNDIINR